MRLIGKICASLAVLIFMATSAAAQDGVGHIAVGDLDVMVIRDADLSADQQLLPSLAQAAPELLAVFQNGPVPGVDQAFYLKNGERKVLIDTGWGKDLKMEGHTADLLHENGIAENEITDILLTHLDWDHIGGLLSNGQPVYPNATLWISRPEYEAWINGEGRSSLNRPDFAKDLAKKVVAAYKVKQFNFGDELLPGITAVDASGHTPGHTAYDIVSGKDKMTIAGDILHVAPVQLARPDISSVYDMDAAKAAASRARLLDRAASEGAIFAGMHFPMVSRVAKTPAKGFVMKEPR